MLSIYTVYATWLTFKGLGDFLAKRDPTRTWSEHIQYILIFCRVHLQRNFHKRWPRHAVLHSMKDIFEGDSVQEIVRRIDGICSVYPELKPWFKNKRKDWMLAALTKEHSKIPLQWWDIALKHTGLAESSHFQDNNWTGRKLTLLGALLA
jgi:hypothetical protein